MSHGGGGGGGMGHGGGMHHGGHHLGGGEPDMSASWNMAYVGDKRTGLMANFNPLPIFIGLIVFSVMILPFVMDWNEPHLQRLLIGHDQTEKEMEHDQAVNQVMAGLMRSKIKSSFGGDFGGLMTPEPEPMSGSSPVAQPQAPAPASDGGAQSSGGIAGFSISADSPPQQQQQQAYAQPAYQQQAGLAPQMAPVQNYMQNYSQPGVGPGMMQQPLPPTVGFSNQRIISQPARAAYAGAGLGGGASAGGIDYHAPRHRVMVER